MFTKVIIGLNRLVCLKQKLISLNPLKFINVLGYQVGVSPNVDFIEDNKSDRVPSKIQGVRVIVDAPQMNSKLNCADYSKEKMLKNILCKTEFGTFQVVKRRIKLKPSAYKPMELNKQLEFTQTLHSKLMIRKMVQSRQTV